MDSISITVTGRLGGDPRQGTTKGGRTWASFTLAVDVPVRNGGGDREYETRWYKVWCHGPLAEHVADSLTKGDQATVRADDVSCRTWNEDAPGQRARGQVELKAYEVSMSLRWDGAVSVRAPRAEPAPTGAGADGTDPWADGGQTAPAPEVPEVLAGVTR